MAEDKEYSNIYTIPPNYTDSGKLMGGMLETRNTVEAGILLALVGYPELMWLHLPVTAKSLFNISACSDWRDRFYVLQGKKPQQS